MPFAAYPEAFVYPEPKQMRNSKAVKHWAWGHYIAPTGKKKNGFSQVSWRGGKKKGWVRDEAIQDDRLLEVNFVDIGQGDGCFIVLPTDERILIDAGESDNMHAFLRWRFNRNPVHIHYAVITHPDKDHYNGFHSIVDDEKFTFGNVFHNGIVERNVGKTLGEKKKVDGVNSLVDVIETPEQLATLLRRPNAVGRKLYPKLMEKMHKSGRVEKIWMLHVEDEYVPYFEDDQPISIEVLGPVPKRMPDGRLALKVLGKDSVTKNGHSVVLRLKYDKMTMLLGGDLNIPAEEHLLEFHTGLDPHPTSKTATKRLLSKGRKAFGCDVMKACHHGSADFMETFIQCANPLVTVVSSGDNESHSHPRPDALGAMGKYSRGQRPLIFSTELARSSREFTTIPERIQERLTALRKELALTTLTKTERRKKEKEWDELLDKKERSVAVYGMISIRTDGKKLVAVQKLEKPRSGTGEKYDIHEFKIGAGGVLEYLSKH